MIKVALAEIASRKTGITRKIGRNCGFFSHCLPHATSVGGVVPALYSAIDRVIPPRPSPPESGAQEREYQPVPFSS